MTDMEYTIKTLDRMADLYAKIGQAAEKREEWKTRNLLLGAWMATLLAKQHIKRKMPMELIDSDYLFGAFSAMLNGSDPEGYA